MKRVGIYGGTFSPPHTGHVEAARAFLESMELDELLIIPTFAPPHKQFSAEVSTEDRLKMCRLAFSSINRARVSDLEIRRGGKSYTYLTLEELNSEGIELFFLCGTDMFLTLDEWKNPERIFELANICCIRRENDLNLEKEIKSKAEKYVSDFGARLYFIDHEAIEISSSDLRLSIASGERHRLLPISVSEYIESRGLYR